MNFCEMYQNLNHHEIISWLLKEKAINAVQRCRLTYTRELYPTMNLSHMGTEKVAKSFCLLPTCVAEQSIK